MPARGAVVHRIRRGSVRGFHKILHLALHAGRVVYEGFLLRGCGEVVAEPVEEPDDSELPQHLRALDRTIARPVVVDCTRQVQLLVAPQREVARGQEVLGAVLSSPPQLALATACLLVAVAIGRAPCGAPPRPERLCCIPRLVLNFPTRDVCVLPSLLAGFPPGGFSPPQAFVEPVPVGPLGLPPLLLRLRGFAFSALESRR
mmetsp:Transcript_67123/g.212442  ORF Transcript_67123/g.212442 Transcript_67123/m.212442 type:complete len:202 (-) Transcript_67123:222-827(-)